jgi:hypothetical protein
MWSLGKASSRPGVDWWEFVVPVVVLLEGAVPVELAVRRDG